MASRELCRRVKGNRKPLEERASESRVSENDMHGLMKGCVKNVLARARCCTGDEGRPFGIGLQEQASNGRKLLPSKAVVVNVTVKRRE